jgi:hypothetical protein
MALKQHLTILASMILLSSVVLIATQTKAANLVSVSADVLDGEDRAIVGLTKQNFKVLEDGVEQTITGFRVQGNGYEISYTSTNTSKDGNWRTIRVDLVGLPAGLPLRVRARQGYYGEKSQ